MLKFRGVAQFIDGTEREFETGNASLAAWERYAMRHKLPMGAQAPPILSSMVIAHHALGIEQGFDAWSETVEGIELQAVGADGEAITVPPTPQEA
jgi:hypothetical protein